MNVNKLRIGGPHIPDKNRELVAEMTQRKPQILLFVCLAVFCIAPNHALAESEDVAAPAADETLIYVLREKRLRSGGTKTWIAVNDQTVARVKNKGHAIIRAKAGRITLNLAATGLSLAQIALDDRAGETVYLKWRVGDMGIREVDEAEGRDFLRKSKRTDPISVALPNNEEIDALLNLSTLGFELMRPATHDFEPDSDHAVITIFRRDDGEDWEFGVWSENDFVGSLKVNQGIRIRVPAGDHFFLSGNVGTTLLKAQVEGGKRYFAWLDFGKMISRVRLTPVARQESDRLDKWLRGVSWVETDSDSITPRIQERIDMVTQFVRSAGERTATGDADFHLLSGEHAY